MPQQFGGTNPVAARVQNVHQGEQQTRTRAFLQIRIREAFFERDLIGCGQLATQQRRQPSMRQGVRRLHAQGDAKGGLGLGQLAQFLVHPAQVQLRCGIVRLQT